VTDPHPVGACADPHLLCPIHDREFYPHNAIHQEETRMTWTRLAQLWRQDAKTAAARGQHGKAVACEYMARRCDQKTSR
jgi:hypothetical protein